MGCQVAQPGPIFPPIDPPLVWPAPPDTPRIRYVGELRGESSLGVKPTGLALLWGLLTGPAGYVEFSRPSAVAVAGDCVYVADIGFAIVHRLDLARREYRVIRGAPEDALQVPVDLALEANGGLLVVDRGRAAVDRLDAEGNWRGTLRWPEIGGPVSLAWFASTATFWIVDATGHACCALDEQWQITRCVGRRGGGLGEFNFPSAIAAHPQTGLVVADAMNFRVQVLDAEGAPRLAFGQKGDAAGDFARPRDVACDSAGHIYVLDNQFENVQIFDSDGQLLMAFGRGGDGPGEFALPAGITIDERNRIWVADSYNRRVQVFEYLAETQS